MSTAGTNTGYAEDVFDRVVDRLIDRIPELDDATCWLTDVPVPLQLPAGGHVCTVAAGAARYPEAFQTASGAHQLVEDGTFDVTILTQSEADQSDRIERHAHGPARGLTRYWKRWILRSLLFQDVENPDTGNLIALPWMPVDQEGYPMLKNAIQVTQCTQPRRLQESMRWLGMTLTFSYTLELKI